MYMKSSVMETQGEIVLSQIARFCPVIAKLRQLACLLAGNVESCAETSSTIANRFLHGTSRAAIAETTLTLGFVVGYKLATFLPIYQLRSTNYAAGLLLEPA